MGTPVQPDSKPRTTQPFDPSTRRFLNVVGVLLAVVGVVAVFKTDTGTGATALVIAGFGLLVLSALGERVTHLRYRDAEVVFGLVEDAAEAEASGDSETADVLLEAALRRASARPDAPPSTLVQEALQYELAVIDVLRGLGAAVNVDTAGEGLDARLRTNAGIEIGVIVKLARKGREIVRGVSPQLLRGRDIHGLLVVARYTQQDTSMQWASDRLTENLQLPVAVVAWQPGMSSAALEGALKRLTEKDSA